MTMLVVTGTQVLAHMVGDYVLQSDWMAAEKVKRSEAALVHVLVYGAAFWAIARPSWTALAVIVGTHFIIDRWRLARHVGWLKNWLSPEGFRYLWAWWKGPENRVNVPRPTPWVQCQGTGYPPEKPPFMAVWLMIIVDQVMHIAINAAAMQVWP